MCSLCSQEFGTNDDTGRIKGRFLALARFQVGRSDTKESILIKINGKIQGKKVTQCREQ